MPPSPPGSEGAILRTIRGEDVAEDDASGFYIPAVVSSVREDRDKGTFLNSLKRIVRVYENASSREPVARFRLCL